MREVCTGYNRTHNYTSNKLYVGKEVRILSNLKTSRYGVEHATALMLKYAGKMAYITQLSAVTGSYRIDIDGGAWLWTPEMFEEDY